jgi:RNA polymerase sigma-B factor
MSDLQAAPIDITTGTTTAPSGTLLALMARREQQIISLRCEHDLTQPEIGARQGISPMHVSRLLRQAIAGLQRQAGER